MKIIFADFSSAFNNIVPSVLGERLSVDFSLVGGVILWLQDFLSNRVQRVCVGTSLSDKQIMNIGFHILEYLANLQMILHWYVSLKWMRTVMDPF